MTIDEGLAEAVAGAARGQVAFPLDFQGFPGTVHGGAVAALFLRLALPRPPVHLRLDLQRGVPTRTPLRLQSGSTGHEARLALLHDDRRLAEGTLSRAAPASAEAGPARVAWLSRGPAAIAMPATATCLACGTANRLGLGLRFQASDRWIWQEYVPAGPYRTPDGTAHPALATVGLDELGWWLGALAVGECGVTTEIDVTLLGPIPWGPLLFVGDRAAVLMDGDPRGRYCRATGHLFSDRGDLLATGRVRFAGSRAYTKRLLGPFRETTDLETLIRLFPSAAELAEGAGGRRQDGVS